MVIQAVIRTRDDLVTGIQGIQASTEDVFTNWAGGCARMSGVQAVTRDTCPAQMGEIVSGEQRRQQTLSSDIASS